MTVAAASAYVQQRGGGDFTDPFRGRPGLPSLVCLCYRVRSAPADGGGGSPPGGCAAAALRLQCGLVCSCVLRPVGYRLWRWRSIPPTWLWYCRSVYGGFLSVRPVVLCVPGDTTMVTSIPWWRLLVGGKMGGALQIVHGSGFFGVRRNPCHLDTDAVALVSVAFPS